MNSGALVVNDDAEVGEDESDIKAAETDATDSQDQRAKILVCFVVVDEVSMVFVIVPHAAILDKLVISIQIPLGPRM